MKAYVARLPARAAGTAALNAGTRERDVRARIGVAVPRLARRPAVMVALRGIHG